MSKSIINAGALRTASTAHTELYNESGLQVHAVASGRFEIKCGSTHTYAHNLQVVSEKIDSLGLHEFPSSGAEVLAAINKKLGSTYKLEVCSSKGSSHTVVHTVEGSKESIADAVLGTVNVDIPNMVEGRRYSVATNMFGGDFAMMTPMSLDDTFELSPAFNTPELYEQQPYSKGDILYGICPMTKEVVMVLVDDAYPNGTFKDNTGKIWGDNEAEVYQLSLCEAAPREDFSEPDDSFFESTDLPTYNPTEDVADIAPMIGNVGNYDLIVSASSGVLRDFMATANKAAYLNKSSLNKIAVSSINEEGYATEGSLEWNVTIASPQYKRSSQITIPMVIAGGNVDIGKEFITSTGAKFPLTPESLSAHLGSLADKNFSIAAKDMPNNYSPAVKANKDIEKMAADVAYKSDEDIATEFEDMSIESIEKDERRSKNLGYPIFWVYFNFPEGDESVGGGADTTTEMISLEEATNEDFTPSDDNLLAQFGGFNNWYPDNVAADMLELLEQELPKHLEGISELSFVNSSNYNMVSLLRSSASKKTASAIDFEDDFLPIALREHAMSDVLDFKDNFQNLQTVEENLKDLAIFIKEASKKTASVEDDYTEYLNEIGVPEHDHPESDGRVPWDMINNYGDWLQQNDPIAFNVGLNEYEQEHGLEASKKTAVKVDYSDDEEISNWMLNDEGLYNWAIDSGIPSDDVGDESSDVYNAFIEENRTEIVDGINRFLGNSVSVQTNASKKTASDEEVLFAYDEGDMIDAEVAYILENPDDYDYIWINLEVEDAEGNDLEYGDPNYMAVVKERYTGEIANQIDLSLFDHGW